MRIQKLDLGAFGKLVLVERGLNASRTTLLIVILHVVFGKPITKTC